MEYNEIQKKNHYFKVVLVRISTDEYIILKGPQEEKLLAEILQDDYNSTRYEKMLQLLADEVVQKDYRETFFKVFSMENMIKQFEEGKTMVEYSYIRNVGSEKKMVNTRVYPRLKQNNKLEELMIYVLS
ncbi:hypothetical protein IMSAGC013_00940 [Lachnospiraceae bacterium]|nr:hypothetical protein [Lachnospiraceae bacterium]GFI29554.1 hypothetical protein IMSAGC013_00940 [Lachnospiraceae bacterium]